VKAAILDIKIFLGFLYTTRAFFFERLFFWDFEEARVLSSSIMTAIGPSLNGLEGSNSLSFRNAGPGVRRF